MKSHIASAAVRPRSSDTRESDTPAVEAEPERTAPAPTPALVVARRAAGDVERRNEGNTPGNPVLSRRRSRSRSSASAQARQPRARASRPRRTPRRSVRRSSRPRSARERARRMTNHRRAPVHRGGAIVTFFLLWATIAAHPWATTEQVTPQDPRLVALAHPREELRKRAVVVNRIVATRWAVYERRSARRQVAERNGACSATYGELEASQAAAVRTRSGGGRADRAGPRVRGKRRHLGQPATPGFRRDRHDGLNRRSVGRTAPRRRASSPPPAGGRNRTGWGLRRSRRRQRRAGGSGASARRPRRAPAPPAQRLHRPRQPPRRPLHPRPRRRHRSRSLPCRPSRPQSRRRSEHRRTHPGRAAADAVGHSTRWARPSS